MERAAVGWRVAHASRADAGRHGHGDAARLRFPRPRRLRDRAQEVRPRAAGELRALASRVRGDAPRREPRVQARSTPRATTSGGTTRSTSLPRALARGDADEAATSRSRGDRRAAASCIARRPSRLSITAGSGGKGTVWIDDLTLHARSSRCARTPARRAATATSAAPGHDAPRSARMATPRHRGARPAGGAQSLTLDFGATRDYGGATIDWAPGAARRRLRRSRPRSTARQWDPRARGARRQRRPRLASTCPRLNRDGCGSHSSVERADATGYGIRELRRRARSIGPTTRNAFFRARGRRARRAGAIRATSSRRAVVLDRRRLTATTRALINEDGVLETARGRLLGRAIPARGRPAGDAGTTRGRRSRSRRGYLPIPTVTWTRRRRSARDHGVRRPARRTRRRSTRATACAIIAHGARRVHALARRSPVPGESAVAVSQRARRRRADRRVSRWEDRAARERTAGVVPLTRAVGVRRRDVRRRRDHRTRCAQATLPPRARRRAIASGIAARAHSTSTLAIPRARATMCYVLDAAPRATAPPRSPPPSRATTRRARVRESPPRRRRRARWTRRSTACRSTLPPSAARRRPTRCARTLAYILINRDGAAIQPGSRSYARSWIRDGSMIVAALLRLGHADEVRALPRVVRAVSVPERQGAVLRRRARRRPGARERQPRRAHLSRRRVLPLHAATARSSRECGRTSPRAVRVHGHAARAAADTGRTRRRRSARVHGLLPAVDQPRGLLGQADALVLGRFLGAARLRRMRHASPTVLGTTARRARFAAIARRVPRDICRVDRAAMARAPHRLSSPARAELGDFDATSTTIARRARAASCAICPRRGAATHVRASTGSSSRARRDGATAWEALHAVRMAHRRHLRAARQKRARARGARLLHAATAVRPRGTSGPRWSGAIRAIAEVHRRHAAHVGRLGLHPLGARHVRVRARVRRRARRSARGCPSVGECAAPGVARRGLRTPSGPLDLHDARRRPARCACTSAALACRPAGSCVALAVRPPIRRATRERRGHGADATAASSCVDALPADHRYSGALIARSRRVERRRRAMSPLRADDLASSSARSPWACAPASSKSTCTMPKRFA